MISKCTNREKSLTTVVDQIIEITRHVVHEWQDGACAPEGAAKLLSESRLDWLLSLSHTLRRWTRAKPRTNEHDGMLILAWANLGSLVEGWLKLLLCVYLYDYQQSVRSKRANSVFKSLWQDKNSVAKDVDTLTLDVLRQFYKAEVWAKNPKIDQWDRWLQHIQERRNAIHAFKNRQLGTFEEFRRDVRRYRAFLKEITGHLPDCPSRSGEW
jgi:hypothetical protein